MNRGWFVHVGQRFQEHVVASTSASATAERASEMLLFGSTGHKMRVTQARLRSIGCSGRMMHCIQTATKGGFAYDNTFMHWVSCSYPVMCQTASGFPKPLPGPPPSPQFRVGWTTPPNRTLFPALLYSSSNYLISFSKGDSPDWILKCRRGFASPDPCKATATASYRR